MSAISTRAGGVAGITAALLLAAGLAVAPAAPGPEASDNEVFGFFIERGGRVTVAVALSALGLILLAPMLATLRLLPALGGRAWAASGAVAAGLLAIGLQCVSLGMLAALGLRTESADPATAREMLDVARAIEGLAGPAFALTLLCAAIAIRPIPGGLPSRLADLALLAAAACALWIARLFSDSGALAAGALGSTAGAVLLVAWILAAGLWLAGGVRRREDPPGTELPGP
jgi:hypothetical protein